MKRSTLGLAAAVAIFLLALWLWGLPISTLPFGDVDSAGHFVLGDYMGQTGKSIYNLPGFIKPMYGTANNNSLWYPPQFHTNEAIFQTIGGQRVVPVYIWIVIAATIVILATYLIISKLYGVMPALLASFLLAFSARDFNTYLWAQWPQMAAFAFVPIILYCYYKYTEGFSEGNAKPAYLYLCGAFAAIQYYFHPQAVGHSAITVLIFTAALIAMHRKLPFSIKHALIAVAVMAVMLLPFFSFALYWILHSSDGVQQFTAPITQLFSWYPSFEQYKGFIPETYFSYSAMHGLWTLPLLLIGTAFLAMRRKRQDVLMLSWLIGYYIMIHLDVLGMLTGRLHKSMFAEAHIFYPIIALGLIAIPSIIGLKDEKKEYAKYALAAVFIALAIMLNAKPAFTQLSNAYEGPYRIGQAQYDSAEWALASLPPDSGLQIAGTLIPAKKKWIGFLAHSIPIYDYTTLTGAESGEINYTDYVLVDYNDIIAFDRKDYADTLLQWEKASFENKTPLYNKGNIRVYQVG